MRTEGALIADLTEFLDVAAAELAKRIAERLERHGGPLQKRLFTIAEAAEYLGRTPRAVECLIQRGAIPVTRIDGKRQLDRRALDRVITEKTYFEK
jgi:excisionase family DNA binding protein